MLQSQWVTVLGVARSGDSSSGRRENGCGCVSECSAGMCCFWCDPFYSHCLSLGLQVGTILIHISVTVPAAARHRECSRGDRATGAPSPPARYVPRHGIHRLGQGCVKYYSEHPLPWLSLTHCSPQINDELNHQFEAVCESVFGEVESQAVEALDLPGCFRMRSHSYLRAIQAGCSQDDDCLSLFSMSAPPGPPITSSILKPSTCESWGW